MIWWRLDATNSTNKATVCQYAGCMEGLILSKYYLMERPVLQYLSHGYISVPDPSWRHLNHVMSLRDSAIYNSFVSLLLSELSTDCRFS